MSTPVDGKAYAYEAQVVKAADYALLGGVKMSGGASITTATTLTPADSGNTFLLTMPATSFNITLPLLADLVGVKYRFVVGTDAAGVINIESAEDTTTPYFFGTDVVGGAAVTGVTITLNGSGLATVSVGDSIEIEGLTSSFVHVRILSAVAESVTIA